MTLDRISAEALAPVPHGFFGRRGGASSGVFAGLNCGRGSSDQSEMVEINRSRVAANMGVEPVQVIGIYQAHSANAIAVDGPLSAPLPEADGVVTSTPGLLLTVLTADCAPVLFADPKAGVIGAAHSGWRGAIGGILESTLDAMAGLGASARDTVAVVGPTISQRVYEVGPEFIENFIDEDTAYTRFFINGEGDRYLFDLPSFCLHRLREAGVGHAEWTGHCTYSDPARFFSFRRSVHEKQADYGRLISTIRL